MASEARILANRANSTRSTGPKSISGKEQSRRNGLKHGMSGQGVVVLEEDSGEIERRAEALRAEMAPTSTMGAILVRQLATLSVRMERGAKQESAAIASRVRHAAEAFDQGRVDEAEGYFEDLADDPRYCLRMLRRSPEGVDLLVRAWRELRDDLTCERRPAWSKSQMDRMANLLGHRAEEPCDRRIEALSRATWANFQGLADHEGGGLGEADRRAWARARLVERIDEEVAGLEGHRSSFDLGAIELDRMEAGDRALFDPSKEASLARRYESEARRGFFKALKEFRQAEAEAVDREGSAPEVVQGPDPSREVARTDAPLGSSREEGSKPPVGTPMRFEVASEARVRASRGPEGPPLAAVRPASMTA